MKNETTSIVPLQVAFASKTSNETTFSSETNKPTARKENTSSIATFCSETTLWLFTTKGSFASETSHRLVSLVACYQKAKALRGKPSLAKQSLM